jgi:hypothetical protein
MIMYEKMCMFSLQPRHISRHHTKLTSVIQMRWGKVLTSHRGSFRGLRMLGTGGWEDSNSGMTGEDALFRVSTPGKDVNSLNTASPLEYKSSISNRKG